MNDEWFKGNWKKVKGAVREKWGKLTDDDLDVIQGKSEQLVGKLQTRYGLAKEEAEKQCRTFIDEVKSKETTTTPRYTGGGHA